jgi:PAS domain S-box-containing protein
MSRQLLLGTGLMLGGLGYLALAWYVWRYRTAAGGRGLLAILLSVFIWTSAYALELSSRSVATAEIWATVKFVGVVAMPPSLLAFSLEYTGRRGLTRRAIGLLSILPVLTVVSMIVPATRDLIHVYDPRQRVAGELPWAPIPATGPLFWPHAIYNYSIAFFSLGLVVVRLARIGKPYRRQANVVMAAALLPLLANIGYNAGLLGANAMDPVPFLFTLFAVVLVWGFFRLRLLDLMPVARDTVLEQMADGVLVLDAYDRVVDSNPAAASLLGLRRPELVGRYVSDLLPQIASVLGQLEVGGAPVRGDVRLVPGLDGTARDLAITLTTLMTGDSPTGRLLLLHDVTERQQAQRRLHDLLAEQTRVADTLQAGLRPASLPPVEGLAMAVRSLPSGVGGQVSGDFYDVHRVLGGDWAFVLGDVSGKGVEAAVLTSLARYTVRTLSAEGRAPTQVLEQLNRALLDDTSERFCTMVYGRIDAADLLRNTALTQADVEERQPTTGFLTLEAAAPVRVASTCVHLRLALGGHPLPLVRRRDGFVEQVGEPGMALGLLGRVDVREVTLELESGDVLVAYTDGVTEARRGNEQFGDERLVDVLAASAAGLRGHTGVTAAHLVAEAVAERLLTTVTGWASRRDDIAILVIAVP